MKRLIPGWFFDYGGYVSTAGVVACATVLFALVVGGILGIAAYDSNSACGYAQAQYKRDTHWNVWRGCYINSSGDQYVPLGAYKVFVQGQR